VYLLIFQFHSTILLLVLFCCAREMQHLNSSSESSPLLPSKVQMRKLVGTHFFHFSRVSKSISEYKHNMYSHILSSCAKRGNSCCNEMQSKKRRKSVVSFHPSLNYNLISSSRNKGLENYVLCLLLLYTLYVGERKSF